MACILILRAQFMRGTGKKISSMVKVLKDTRTALSMRVNLQLEKSTERANILGLIEENIMANGSAIK